MAAWTGVEAEEAEKSSWILDVFKGRVKDLMMDTGMRERRGTRTLTRATERMEMVFSEIGQGWDKEV